MEEKRPQSEQSTQKADETDISVTSYEAAVVADILQVALQRMPLDADARQKVQTFKYKLNKARLIISRQYLNSLPRIP
jgi:hypothetical protein